MKIIISVLLASLFMFGCSNNKKATNTSSDGNCEPALQNADETQQSSVDPVQDTSHMDEYMDKEYIRMERELKSRLSYCKYVTIGKDTVFFTKNEVGHERLDNYMMPYSLARSYARNYALYPLYSIAIVYEKGDIIAIAVWNQTDGEQNDFLLVYNKTTGKLLSNTLIADGGGGDCDVDVQMSLKNDTLTVYESIDCWHTDCGYSYSESKKCFVVNSNGSVKEIVLLSAPEMFKDQTAIFTDKPAELRLFELIYMMPNQYLERCGINWSSDDRKQLLYCNVEMRRLVKSHAKMKSIAYSNYNLTTTIENTYLNFHLYKANDGREFLTISSVDSTKLSSYIESYQYIDSCFVENNDFIPASLLGSNTDKHFSFDGDKLTITTSSSATTTYVFDKDKGSMTEIR